MRGQAVMMTMNGRLACKRVMRLAAWADIHTIVFYRKKEKKLWCFVFLRVLALYLSDGRSVIIAGSEWEPSTGGGGASYIEDH